MNKFDLVVKKTSNSINNKLSIDVRDVDINLIDMDDMNTYLNGYEDQASISASIEEIGMKSIICVYEKEDGRFLCYSGHMRLIAAKENGLKKITCQIDKEPSEEDKIKNLIYMNLQRTKRPLYIARSIKEYEKLLRKNGDKNSYDKISKIFNLSEKTIKRYLKVLELPNEFQELCKDKDFPFTILVDKKSGLQDEDYNVIYKVLEEINFDVDSKKMCDIIDNIKRNEEKRQEEKGIHEKKSHSIEQIINKIYKSKENLENTEIKNREETLRKAIEIKDYVEQIIKLCEGD